MKIYLNFILKFLFFTKIVQLNSEISVFNRIYFQNFTGIYLKILNFIKWTFLPFFALFYRFLFVIFDFV